MKAISKKIKPYLSAYLFFFIIGLFSMLFYQKGQFELWLNSFHHSISDLFFMAITPLGDGLIIILPLLVLASYRYSQALLLLWASIVQIVLVSLGKQWLFKGFPRPAEFLKDVEFYRIPGFELHHWNSFPSGHTATIFMLTAVLCMVLPRKLQLQRILFITAVLVGFSRIYLMQHFWVDVYVGSALGVVSALLGRRITVLFFSGKKYQRGLLPKRRRVLPQPSS